MKVNLATIKSWFKTGGKPTQEQFSNAFDSFFHKDETIPSRSVEGLSETVLAVAELDRRKLDKVEGKGLSSNDFTDEDKERLYGIEVYRVPNTAYISKTGNDETGEVGNPNKAFASFMGALAKVPEDCKNYTIFYYSDKIAEYFYENNIDLSNGDTI